MKKQNIYLKLSVKYIYYFLLFIVFSYFLSHILVEGSEIISVAINDMFEGKFVNLKSIFFTILIFVILSMLISFFKKLCGEQFSLVIQKESRNYIVKKIEEIEYAYINEHTGTLITKLISDIEKIGQLYSEIIPEIFQSIITILALSYSIFKMDWILLLSIVICYPLVMCISNNLAKNINRLAKSRRAKYDELTQVANDDIAGIAIARSYGLNKILNERVEKIANDILGNEIYRNKYQAIGNVIQSLVKWIPSVICSLIALMEFFKGQLSIGDMMAFIILFNKISSPMSELPFKINDGRELLISIKRINEIMDAPKEHSGTYCGNTSDLSKTESVICFKDVSFWYNSNREKRVFDKLNIDIKKGTTTAIVGSSGVGKSTLFKIICGLEKVREGDYYLYEQNFRNWNLTAARKEIALVSQNVFLFADTIFSNITYGMDDVSIEVVIDACKAACIHDYIITLPDGYQTFIGENGVNLSGGQRQRLTIARAFLKSSSILLLDEPTSALDVKTEEAINRIIETRKNNQTVIIIAHRLSTIRNADDIIVLHKGKVAERGCHFELLGKEGLYSKLYNNECEIGIE